MGDFWIQITNVTDGHFPFFFFPAMLVMLWRLKQGNLRRAEKAIALALLVHSGIYIVYLRFSGHPNLPKRYFAASIPLLLGWATLAGREFYSKILGKCGPRHKYIARVLIVIFIGVCLWDSMHPYRPSLRPKKRHEKKSLRSCAEWIRTEGIKYVDKTQKRLESQPYRYHNGRLPIVMTAEPAIGYHAAADRVGPRPYFTNIKRLAKFCRAWHVNYVVVDEDMERQSPIFRDIGKLTPEPFVICYQSCHDSKYPRTVLGFLPNLQNPSKK